jgi:hypothetical protein
MAGVDVDIADPPEAITPARGGIEKYVPAQARGAEGPICAAPLSVTTNGLFSAPLAPTVIGVVKVCELAYVDVAKLHETSLGVSARHPVRGASSVLLV